MKRKKFSLGIVLLCVAVLSGTFFGCTSSSGQASSSLGNVMSSAGKQTNITFWYSMGGLGEKALQKMIGDFNSSQKNIHVDAKYEGSYTDAMNKLKNSIKGGQLPDIVQLGDEDTRFMMENKNVVPIQDLVDAEKYDLSTLEPNILAFYSLGGKLYGMPFNNSTPVLYYNKDLFKSAGIDKAPATKDELIADAQKLTVDTSGKNSTESGFNAKSVKQYGFGFLQNHHTFYQIYALMNQQGYNPFTSDMTKITLDKTKTANAIQFFEDLAYKYKVVPIGEKSPIDDFKAGTVAMVVDGNWQLSGMNTVTFNWDTAVYPQIFEKKAVWGASELLALPKNSNSTKQKAAQTFVKWLSDNSAKWALSGQIPANIAAQKAATNLKGINAYKAELDYVTFLPAHPKATKIFSSAAPSPILTAAQSALLNNRDAGGIVTQLETDINKVLAS